MKKSLLFILAAKDFDEEEFIIIRDTLQNRGFELFIASDAVNLCTGNKGLRVKTDMNFYNVHAENFAGLVFIGGNGIRNYWENTCLHSIALKFNSLNRPIAAICAAPVILCKAGLLDGRDATCFEDDRKELQKCGVNFIDKPVVKSANIITAQNAKNSLDFGNLILHTINS